MTTRVCKDCGAEKPEQDFYFNRKRNGYSARCKECYRAAMASRRRGVAPATLRKTAPPGMWQCSVCNRLKVATQFNRDVNKPRGHSYTCKSCAAAYQRKRKEVPDGWRYRRNYYLQRYFGISLEEYEQLYEAQNRRCALCDSEGDDARRTGNVATLFVDHCHTSGKVRGLLCQRCNTALGMFRDNVSVLEKAIAYLSVPDQDRHSLLSVED